jgi:hypothetical protein
MMVDLRRAMAVTMQQVSAADELHTRRTGTVIVSTLRSTYFQPRGHATPELARRIVCSSYQFDRKQMLSRLLDSDR